MMTQFASAERTSDECLHDEIEIINRSPVMSGLLDSVNGLLAIIDENRQILSVNHSFMELLGVDNPADLLGLRPGEAFKCEYADKGTGGCGTSKYCSTCGAVIAILSSIKNDEPVEKKCSVTAQVEGQSVDLVFMVKSNPVLVENKRFLLLFLQDITEQERRAGLERTFFHDFNNMLTGLLGASAVLQHENPNGKIVNIVQQAAVRMKNEIELQEYFMDNNSLFFKPLIKEILLEDIMEELQSFYFKHPAGLGKSLNFPNFGSLTVSSDKTLLLRVLCNMIVNALEATPVGGEAKVWADKTDDGITIIVWNSGFISLNKSLRIFKKNFTTKEGSGHGIGTFSMKLIGEDILGGRVDFTSSKEEGTAFKYFIPAK